MWFFSEGQNIMQGNALNQIYWHPKELPNCSTLNHRLLPNNSYCEDQSTFYRYRNSQKQFLSWTVNFRNNTGTGKLCNWMTRIETNNLEIEPLEQVVVKSKDFISGGRDGHATRCASTAQWETARNAFGNYELKFSSVRLVNVFVKYA